MREQKGAHHGLCPPINIICIHQHSLKTREGSWIMQVDLSWTYLISSTAAELVWDLSRGLIQVNFNKGILDKLVKSKRLVSYPKYARCVHICLFLAGPMLNL